MSEANTPRVSEDGNPQSPLRLTVIEFLAIGLGLRLTIDPSVSVAVGLVALAGAWALEKIFVSHARVYRNCSIDAREAAAAAEKAAVEARTAVGELEARIQRLENRAGWNEAGRR